jgi:hypothetical protein
VPAWSPWQQRWRRRSKGFDEAVLIAAAVAEEEAPGPASGAGVESMAAALEAEEQRIRRGRAWRRRGRAGRWHLHEHLMRIMRQPETTPALHQHAQQLLRELDGVRTQPNPPTRPPRLPLSWAHGRRSRPAAAAIAPSRSDADPRRHRSLQGTETEAVAEESGELIERPPPCLRRQILKIDCPRQGRSSGGGTEP